MAICSHASELSCGRHCQCVVSATRQQDGKMAETRAMQQWAVSAMAVRMKMLLASVYMYKHAGMRNGEGPRAGGCRHRG